MQLKHLIYLLVIALTIFSTRSVNAKSGHADTLRIAVASNFLATAHVLSNAFEASSEYSIQISSGSSGKLYLQIINGAPFDLFLSADSHKPTELVKNAFALADTQQTYAIGKLTLWLKDCSIQSNLNALSNDLINKVAIANPKLAPYGYASKQLLLRHNLWDKISTKLIYPENIAQVAQFAKLGVIEGALIAESNASKLSQNGKSCLIKLQAEDYPSIIQQLVILSKSKNKDLAREFIQFLGSEEAKSLIKNMGYLLPNSVKIAPTR